MFTRQELTRYSRQILLPEIGLEGQQKLKQGSVLVIGAGGLGSPALYYLAAAGIGRIGIVDFDKIDESNLHRQILYTADQTGLPKAKVAAERVAAINPYIQVDTYECAIDVHNAMDLIGKYDVILDGSDNLPTRYLVNDACVFLGKTLIYGAVFQFEGQVSVFNQPGTNGQRGPNYRDLFPEPPPPEMVPSCSAGGVLGVLPGIVGTMQANETIKVIANIGQTLSGRLMAFDSLDFSTRYLKLLANPDNPVSGKNPTIKTLIDYEAFCNPAREKTAIKEISPSEVKKLLDNGDDFQLIDVREVFEYDISNIGGLNIPLGAIKESTASISKTKKVVLHCKSGQRSGQAIKLLERDFGFTNLWNMKGGLVGWQKEVEDEFNLA
jgi:molybdopterin/thiamine biosynthesis adenylyltransferase/rhodanese-related sulfurtransferase